MLQNRCVVLNKTQGVCISAEAEVAHSVFKRMKGLIGRSAREFAQGNGLWITPCNGIHTVGMSFPIDVAYLDSEKRIIKVYHNLAPFRFGGVTLKAKSVLELPAGSLARTNTVVGHMLEFQQLSDIRR